MKKALSCQNIMPERHCPQNESDGQHISEALQQDPGVPARCSGLLKIFTRVNSVSDLKFRRSSYFILSHAVPSCSCVLAAVET